MKYLERFLEILPLALALCTFAFPLVFIQSSPQAVVIFVMLYIFFWFLRALEFSFFLIFSFFQYKKALKKDWQALLKSTPEAEDIVHLIIIPTFGEEIDVLRSSLGSVVESQYDHQKIFLCLATEERDKERGRENAAILLNEFGPLFGRFVWSEHPANLPGEIIGKGANISFAGKKCQDLLTEEGVPLENILVTTLDADNRVHPSLFSALSLAFVLSPDRQQRSFQPIPLFFNNIWDVPIINRIVALSSGFWHLIEAGRPDRLRNFSSHTQPFLALCAMDFWDKTTIVEDGRQFFRSFLHFQGRYEVVPVFLPIFQDAVLGKNYFRSLVGQFHQLRRWAWGSSDIAYFGMGIMRQRKTLPIQKSLLHFIRLLEGHYMWATAAIFLYIGPWSFFFFNPEFLNTPFGLHFSVFLGTLFHWALLGIVISIALTFLMVPAPPKKMRRWSVLFQWILLPLVTVIFGSLPALWSQTQLAFRKKMAFHVTEKIQKLASDEKK